MTKGEIAKQYFLKGYNCTQAVMLAFYNDLGIDEQTALMIPSPFGGGIGRMREVCGALSGTYMVLGLKRGYNEPNNTQGKTRLYKEVQELAAKFKEDNGSIICRELLKLRIKGKDSPAPSERTDNYYKNRPCPELCRYAADLIDEFLKSKETE
ncbi:MAG: C_GCAxxG_C_C family protein [Ruminococcus sp.]|nr:C_GCAxxG_C_C family protein [Ruminococcus sp.]